MRAKNKQKKLSLFDKIVLGLNIIVSFCLILSYLAPYTDPKESSIIAVFGLGMFFILAVNLVFLFYWAFRHRIFLIVSLISTLLGLPSFSLSFRINTENHNNKKDPNTIRLMQYNVNEFKGLGKYQDLSIQHNIFDVIDSEEPDILCVEDFKLTIGDKTLIVDSLKGIMKAPYYSFKPFLSQRSFVSGNAIFSKFPIIQSGIIDSASILNPQSMYADLNINKKIIRVYCIHLQSVNFKKTDHRYLKGKVDFDATFRVVDKLKFAFIKRSYQVAKLKKHIATCPYPYILAGDFNDTPVSFALHSLEEGLTSGFQEKGNGFGFTYYNDFPNVQIDHILVTKQFKFVNFKIKKEKLSDHYPIISDLKID